LVPGPTQQAQLTGSFAIAGLVVGGLLTLAIEGLRRRWSVADRAYASKTSVLDGRCDQAETYAASFTEDLRRLMHDAEASINDPDPAAPPVAPFNQTPIEQLIPDEPAWSHRSGGRQHQQVPNLRHQASRSSTHTMMQTRRYQTICAGSMTWRVSPKVPI
jgi:hypothetical protein